MNDPLGDMLTRIRNGLMRNKSKISSPASKLRANVCEVLKSEGYIRDYATIEHGDGKSEIEIELKYYEGAPVIREISRVSRPGLRVYSSVKSIPRPERPQSSTGRSGNSFRSRLSRTWPCDTGSSSSPGGRSGSIFWRLGIPAVGPTTESSFLFCDFRTKFIKA